MSLAPAAAGELEPDSGRDAGFTLVEMLVALLITAVLGGVVMSTLIGSQSSARTTTNAADLNAEARGALNRISEDLQQAVPVTEVNSDGSTTAIPAITAVTNPDGPNYSASSVTSFTFNADFAGAGCVSGLSYPTENLVPLASASPCPSSAPDPSSPDTETVCWGGSADQHIYLIGGTVTPGTCTPTSGSVQPLLSGRVSALEVYYRSNDYLYSGAYDQSHPGYPEPPGVTTWYDLDAAGPPVGNNDGKLDVPELNYINGVVIAMTLSEGSTTVSFQTEVDLRNVP